MLALLFKYRKGIGLSKVGELIEKLRKFKRDKKIEKLILFGSFARGEYKPESDVDLIVVDKRFVGIDRFKRGKGFWISWHKKHRISYPVDFLFYTPKEFEKLKREVSIVSEALKEGIEI